MILQLVEIEAAALNRLTPARRMSLAPLRVERAVGQVATIVAKGQL